MWLLRLSHLPCVPGHLFYLYILQSAGDQGQDFWRHLQGLWRTRRSQPLITCREEPHGGAEQHTTWQRSCLRFTTHPFFDSYTLKESLKEWAKKTMRTGTFFPSPSIAAIFFFAPTYSPILPGLPALSKSDMGDPIFKYWKAPGTWKIISSSLSQTSGEERRAGNIFAFLTYNCYLGLTFMHAVTVTYLNLTPIFVVSWSDPLNKSPALWVYCVCVCSVTLEFNKPTKKPSPCFFLSSVHFFQPQEKGDQVTCIFFPALLFFV